MAVAAVNLLPGNSFPVLLVNSLLLMRAGLSKHQAMAMVLTEAGYRPRSKSPNSTPPGTSADTHPPMHARRERR